MDWERVEDSDRDAYISVLLTLRRVSIAHRDKLGEAAPAEAELDYELDDDGWPVYNNPVAGTTQD